MDGRLISALPLFALAALAACAAPSQEPEAPEPIGLANPASVHCARAGGRSEIRRAEAGEYGVCLFPDGRQCEEWALYRDGRCAAPQPARP